MISTAPDNLACPICSEPLSHRERQLACGRGHSFDLARQGYVNLLPVQHKKSREPGDSKTMVVARQAFLDGGYYEPIAEQLAREVATQLAARAAAQEPLRILDAGSGEGYYLDFLIRELCTGSRPEATVAAIGLDISKEAVLAATRRNRQVQWVVGTNVHPPVRAGTLDAILCLFGFPSFEHFRQLLRPGGFILLADPGPDHLIELRQLIYPEVRRSPVSSPAGLDRLGLELKHSDTLRFSTAEIPQPQLQNLLAMTPHLYRASHEGKQAAAGLEKLRLTVEVVFRVFGLKR